MKDNTYRTERRKQKTRETIIATAISLFERKSSVEVSLESIADKADISRKTLYNHFSGKEQLICEIISPIFGDGSSFLDKALERQSVTINDILNLCIFLWDKYGKMLQLLYNIDFEEHGELQEIHGGFLEKFLSACERAEELPKLGAAMDVIPMVIYKCFVPLISSLEGTEERDELFRKAMVGMINGLEMGTRI